PLSLHDALPMFEEIGDAGGNIRARATAEVVAGIGLGVEIDQQRAVALRGADGGQVTGDAGLADAALLIEHHPAHAPPPRNPGGQVYRANVTARLNTRRLSTKVRSDRYRRLDVRMRLVADQLEILEAEAEQVLHLRVELHRRQRQRLAGQLQIGLLQVVGVQMAVTAAPDELARREVADLRHHQRQQCIAGDVEGYAEE